MMRLYASLFLLVNVFIFKSNGDACAQAKLTCNSLEITLDPAITSINGVYTKVENENNLYQKGSYYFSYYAAKGYYTIAEVDNRCLNGISYNVKVEESSLAGLTNGVAESFNPAFPSDRTISIACDGVAEVVTPAPTIPAPVQVVSGLGSVCLSTTYGGTLTSTTSNGDEISTVFSNLAGEYEEIDNMNGKPAYQLSSSCEQTNPSYSIIYASGRYRLVRDVTSPVDNTILSCSNYETITNDDITQCEWGSVNDLLTISSTSGTCGCGLPTPTPTTPAQVQVVSGEGDLCFRKLLPSTTTSSVGVGAKSTSLADQAGTYKEIANINGKPAYQLSSDCNEEQFIIMYVSSYSRYMIVRDQNDASSYFNYCQKNLPNDDVTQCVWASANDAIDLSVSSGACDCVN